MTHPRKMHLHVHSHYQERAIFASSHVALLRPTYKQVDEETTRKQD